MVVTLIVLAYLAYKAYTGYKTGFTRYIIGLIVPLLSLWSQFLCKIRLAIGFTPKLQEK